MLHTRKHYSLTKQIIFLVILILVIPLGLIFYYFYSSTNKNMNEIGQDRGYSSIHIAQSLIDKLGNNQLSLTNSNSHWEEFREAIQKRDIPWIEQNVNGNIDSVPNIDFIVTTDNNGNVISSVEKHTGIVQDLSYSTIEKRAKQENDFSGLLNTSQGLAIVSVSKVTNEAGNAAAAGSLLFGHLLNQSALQDIKDTLQSNIGILTTSGQMLSTSNGINLASLKQYVAKLQDTSVYSDTSNVDNTIYVHASKPLLDITGKRIGIMYLETPLTTSTHVMINIKRITTLDIIIILGLLLIMTFFLQRRVVLPLKHFTKTLEEVAAGSSVDDIPQKILAHAEDNIVSLFDKLHRLAFYDYLTDLPNRRYCSNLLEQTIQDIGNQQQKVAVMYLDLDRFKIINDSLGHSTGDRLLQLVARRLKECAAGQGSVARLGGDEFTIIMPNIETVFEAEQLAKKIAKSFSQQFLVDDYDLYVTTSIGISMYPDDGTSVDALFMNADVAMYRAKEQGRNKYQFYNSSMNATTLDKLKVETMLRRAIDHHELFLAYQPKINVKTGEIIGMEALVRWLHPELGIIAPNDFIPIAEETGLIMSIGEWVLRTACAQNKLWQDQGLPPLRVSVNISAREFQNDIVTTVTKVLAETGLDSKWLELEITESTVMKFADETIHTLNQLIEMGINISIDDFGTGYSSLSYLKLFPITSLKIDRSFIKDIDKSNRDVAVAKSVITLGHALDFEVIAEGVESQKHLDVLKGENCDIFQGFLYSPPVSKEAFEAMLVEKNVKKEK